MAPRNGGFCTCNEPATIRLPDDARPMKVCWPSWATRSALGAVHGHVGLSLLNRCPNILVRQINSCDLGSSGRSTHLFAPSRRRGGLANSWPWHRQRETKLITAGLGRPSSIKHALTAIRIAYVAIAIDPVGFCEMDKGRSDFASRYN